MVKLSFFSKTIKMTVCMVIMAVATNAAAQVENGQQPADEVELVVTGDGATKEQATLSALRNALEQAYGTFVSSNTKILNDELVKDEIVSISTGNIKEYQYLTENEIDGKNYVTIRAVVSVDKLTQYVKSKGGEAELAGALFAKNVKIKKLNEENLNRATWNIGEQQLQMFPKCFNCEITVSEPQENNRVSWVEELEKVGLAYNRYCVRFTVTYTYNENAANLQTLEKQKHQLWEHAKMYYNKDNSSPATEKTVIPLLLEKIKITDNIGEYKLKFNGEYHNSTAGDYAMAEIKSNIDKPRMWRKDQYGHFRNKIMADFTKGAFLLCNSFTSSYRAKVFDWETVAPGKTFLKFSGVMLYTLNDLEKSRA